MNESAITEAVTISKVLGSETRLRILDILVNTPTTNDVCVKEIADTIGLSHSATSHQLSRLEDKGIVQCCRNGQTMCYSITSSPLAERVRTIIKQFN